MVSTLDSESSDPSSNLGRTYIFIFLKCYIVVFFNFICHLTWCVGRDSSVGRALDWRSKGPRFDPGSRHFCKSLPYVCVAMDSSNKRIKAPPRVELGISCLRDRRFNQLSHGAWITLLSVYHETNSNIFLKTVPYKKKFAQRGARTHDPEIKSLMLYRLS